MKKFTVQENTNLRDFTDAVYPQGSFALPRLLREREVRVNGAKTGRNVPLCPGDEVTYFTTPKEEAKPFYREVYRDGNILVADKFAGVSSEALFSALREDFGARFIHRLDRNTAGLIVFALNGEAEGELLAAFRGRSVRKEYGAVCFHPFAKKSAVLTAYLKKDAGAARVRVFSSPVPGAEKICTEYETEEEFGEYTRVRILLHSGKTHQIRAHMAFIGNPVAGDEKYGDEALNKKYHLRRQLLAAEKLSFAFGGALSYLNGRTFLSSFRAQMPPEQGKA